MTTRHASACRWDRPGVPHAGWTCEGMTDLGEPSHVCEMCGQEEIRYVHTMVHPDHPALDVGCVCAGHMSGDYVGARRRESRLKYRAIRRARWLSREWRVSRGGNEYLNLNGHNLGVIPNRFGSGWKWRIGGRFSAWSYPSASLAKLALFDELNPAIATEVGTFSPARRDERGTRP